MDFIGGDTMTYTPAQKKAILKYLENSTDEVRIRVRKGTKERWREYAALAGKSMTAYIHDAVEEQIAYDNSGEHELDSDLIPNLMKWLKNHGHNEEEILECIMSLAGEKSDND